MIGVRFSNGRAAVGKPKKRPSKKRTPIPSLNSTMASVSEQLNARGFFVVALRIERDAFRNAYTAACREWFSTELRAAFEPRDTPTFKDAAQAQRWKSGRTEWVCNAERPAQVLARLLTEFDLSTHAGRAKLFSNDDRKRAVKTCMGIRTCAVLLWYTEDTIKLVKYGGVRTAQGPAHSSWLSSGFGFHTFVITQAAVDATLELLHVLRESGFDYHLSGLPHVIFKPPKSSKLPAHHDGPRSPELIEFYESIDLATATNADVVRKFGSQQLCHLDEASCTFFVGPMSPRRHYLCLVAFRDRTLGLNDADVWADKGSYATFFPTSREDKGPAWLAWDAPGVLAALNAMLATHGETPNLHVMKMVPDVDGEGAFAVGWPVGYPHGSLAGDERLGFTAPLTLSVDAPRDERVPARVDVLATINDPTSSADDVRAADAVIASQTKPFHGGAAHLRPELGGRWTRANGYFAGLGVTKEGAATFRAEWARGAGGKRARDAADGGSTSEAKAPRK